MNLSKMTFPVLLLLSGFSLSFVGAYQADDIVGEWYTEGNESIISIYKKGNLYFGNISWVEEPHNEDGSLKKDVLNPDKSKREDLITEVVLLHHFKFDGSDTWSDGIIYNPEDGKDYTGRITLKGINTLSLRGYIGIPLLGKSTIWERKQ